ncbi:OmpA family protein [Nonomuraea muscovyensis]|uniref:Outer membrane protein OmpA-like peptidoglycan-associated protein n=1 Tax=Nonomuraea muscovyensis TaxID=1124761 RepID=A0A7X0CCM3_9ACTN|nr:OmpA family protein [Nonomuraea muscovyensis]MBB6350834.1 outer membrane protein OmpA-like peptidoglycan-associated protein [Nonomuraea muscovyensis]
MSRSPSAVLAAAVLTVSLVASPAAAAATPVPTPPPGVTGAVEDLVLPVEDIIGEVESLDGTESQSRRGTEVTVALTSDVLFAVDKWVLTAQARRRLEQVAAKVRTEAAGGVVRIEGHTDDQGADAYNRRLSQRRAQAVEQVMHTLLDDTGVTLQARGYGESRPKAPNLVDGKPVAKNRARNRRVEIVFDARQ